MNDIWNNWNDAQTIIVEEGSTIYIRTFFDDTGDCFTIVSQFCHATNTSRAVFYRGWE